MIKKYVNDDAKLAIYLEKKLDLPSSSLSSKKKLGLIEEWDSLAHLSLIMLIEKEMKMPMLFDTKEQAEKEAYKFECEGAHQMGDKWMPCSMHEHNH